MATPKIARRGDLFWLEWQPHRGVEQAGTRPTLVLQEDYLSEYLRSLVVVALSTGLYGDDRLHINIEPSRLNGLTKPGVVLCEQIMTIDASRLKGRIGVLEPRYLEQVEIAIKKLLGFR